jgi:hypothetical protein
MKKKITKEIVFILLACISISHLYAQKMTETENLFDNGFYPSGRSNVEVGLFIPQGNLKNNLKVSTNISYYIGVQFNEKYALDLGTSVFIPNKPKTLNYFLKDSAIEGKPMLSGTLGLWLSRIEKLHKKYTWENRFGTGIGFLQTDIPTGNPKECNDDVRGSETIFLNLGTSLKRKINSRKDVGVSINYYYTPYNLFEKHLVKGFGNQYATVGISYGIN